MPITSKTDSSQDMFQHSSSFVCPILHVVLFSKMLLVFREKKKQEERAESQKANEIVAKCLGDPQVVGQQFSQHSIAHHTDQIIRKLQHRHSFILRYTRKTSLFQQTICQLVDLQYDDQDTFPLCSTCLYISFLYFKQFSFLFLYHKCILLLNTQLQIYLCAHHY